MSLWTNILELGARGEAQRAREVLLFELPVTLRDVEFSAGGEWRYKGVLPQVVGKFIGKLPDSDRGMAASRADDLVDYVIDKLVASVERSLLLVEFCCTHPDMTIDQIVQAFPGWGGYKRNEEEKRKYVVNLLRSMIHVGIPLPAAIKETLGDEGEAKFEFNEIALARGWHVDRSWNDFKEDQEIDFDYRCIDESDEEEPGVHAEAIDLGLISMSKVILNLTKRIDKETELDFQRFGEELGPELTALMESMHGRKPADGYRPIAWHNVFWKIWLQYKGLYLSLDMRDPHCDVDHKLADYIAEVYTDVSKPNRLNIARRRKTLYDACDAKISARLKSWAGLNK